MCYRILRLWLAIAGALLVLPAAASAQPSYRITLKEPDNGTAALYRKLMRFRMAVTVARDRTGARFLSDEQALDIVYLETLLEKPTGANPPKKLQRRYLRGERTTKGGPQPLSLVGQTLLIDKPDGYYRFRTADGKTLDRPSANTLAEAASANALYEEFHGELPRLPRLGAAWLLPKIAVKVGESWSIDPGDFVGSLFGTKMMKLEPGQASGKGRLLRAYQTDGRQHGVLEFRIEVPIKSFDLVPLRDAPKANKLVFRMVVDACIDGSRHAYRLKGSLECEFLGDIEADSGIIGSIRGRVQGDYFESRQEADKE
jgi:hypothetical protein